MRTKYSQRYSLEKVTYKNLFRTTYLSMNKVSYVFIIINITVKPELYIYIYIFILNTYSFIKNISGWESNTYLDIFKYSKI